MARRIETRRFEAFVERGDKRREYCGNEGAYPCDESRRREKIFYENAEVALALDRTALLGRRHSRKHRPEDEEDEEDATRKTRMNCRIPE